MLLGFVSLMAMSGLWDKWSNCEQNKVGGVQGINLTH